MIASGDAACAGRQGGNHDDPVVFGVGGDPVGVGLVASLARPGGNLTGLNFFELSWRQSGWSSCASWCRELPRWPCSSILPIRNAPRRRDVEKAARAIGLQIRILNAECDNSQEIDTAFATLARERPDALFVGGDTFFNSRRVQLVHLATRHAIPATYSARQCAEAGGLISYGANIADGIARSALCRPHPQGCQACGAAGRAVDQVRAGDQRRDREDAGLTVPSTLLATADEVIE